MKLATFVYDDAESFGVVTQRGVLNAASLRPDGPRTCLELIQAGPCEVAKLAELAASSTDAPIPLDRITLRAPIANPPKLMGLAGNYVKHIQESNLAKGLSPSPTTDTTPRPFLMPSTAVADPGQEIAWCDYSKQIDYEAELAIVIGSACKCVSPAGAADCIAGYTIANDISARSTTLTGGRSVRPWDEFYDWLHGKWGDGFCPLGPFIVTPDEIGDVRNLAIQCSVNGQARQDDNTASMIFDVYRIVSFVSHIMTLTPGDIIATGTPSGVGMATGDYLAAGDVITCSIENIGELTNTLGKRPDSFYAPCEVS